MKRFRFGLQNVLGLRTFTESAAKASLAAKSGACALLERSLEENAAATLAAARERFRPGGSASDYRAGERYALWLAARRERLMRALAAAELERDAARQVYVEARKAKELVGKLKEREEAAYYRAASREEFKALDDIAATAWARADKEGVLDGHLR